MTSANETETAYAGEQECPQCSSRRLHQDRVKSAFWHDEGLVVIEEIPAIVCETCGERFYDDTTVMVLDLMRGDGFSPAQASRQMHVPVYSFSARIPMAPATFEEEKE